jgi:8-oxo-dGTP diphosphatase
VDCCQQNTKALRLCLAAAVVVHEDQVLIVRRSLAETFKPGIWGVPCGKIDAKEKPRNAVLRELEEETGLSGRVLKYAGIKKFQSHWHGRLAINVQRNYLISPLHGACALDGVGMPWVRTPELDQAYRWVSIDEVEQQDLDDHNLGTIRQGLKARLALRTACKVV